MWHSPPCFGRKCLTGEKLQMLQQKSDYWICLQLPPWIGNAQNALPQNPTLFTCHVVGRKVRWMVRVVILHEEEFPDGHGTQCQHCGAQLSQRFPV